MSSFLNEFHFTIVHQPAHKNRRPDALSRVQHEETTDNIEMEIEMYNSVNMINTNEYDTASTDMPESNLPLKFLIHQQENFLESMDLEDCNLFDEEERQQIAVITRAQTAKMGNTAMEQAADNGQQIPTTSIEPDENDNPLENIDIFENESVLKDTETQEDDSDDPIEVQGRPLLQSTDTTTWGMSNTRHFRTMIPTTPGETVEYVDNFLPPAEQLKQLQQDDGICGMLIQFLNNQEISKRQKRQNLLKF
jgi:hypothetical protein